MRTLGPLQLPPVTRLSRGLMIAIGGVFLAQVLTRVILGFDSGRYAEIVERTLALSGAGVFKLHYVWQPFTYFWISPLSGIGPVLFSLLAIYIFTPPLEQQLGRTRTLIAFVSAGVAGGLLHLLVAGVFLSGSPYFHAPFMGAQAATAGMIATLCWWWRDQPMNLIVIQPLGWHVLVGFTALIVLQGLLMPHPFLVVDQLGGILMGMGVASGHDPFGLFQKLRLWRLRRRIRVLRGGKDDRDWMN